MNAYDIIYRKRNGEELDGAELRWFIEAYTRGEVRDYQAAALLMAVFFRGMSDAELGAWTRAMLESGEVLDLSDLGATGLKVDKHSTGGVGDKVSLPLAPLVAAAGVVVPMISGRGLGHTGGTLDKLESIPGFRTDLSVARFRELLATLGLGLIGQTGEIAPADKKLYALRDVTATVDCIPLIASSIMSKKLAEGIDALVLDVKVGRGAFMKAEADARVLAQTMIGIGRAVGCRVVARLTDMNQPLGRTVGNALEVIESVELLRGEGPDDLLDVVLTLGADMLRLAGLERDHQAAVTRLQRHIDDGSAYQRFLAIVEAQGGDPRAIDDLSRLPSAAHSEPLLAPRSGVVHQLDALAVGEAGRALGAGRQTMDDAIDPGAGIVLHRKVGDGVEAGEPIATLYAADPSLFAAAARRLQSGLIVADGPAPALPLLIDSLGWDDAPAGGAA